jgi:hypothetical protein
METGVTLSLENQVEKLGNQIKAFSRVLHSLENIRTHIQTVSDNNRPMIFVSSSLPVSVLLFL